MHANRGFTLIEILVVIVIMGITVSFAMLAFGDFGASRRVMVTAEQFSSYVKLIQQQAILESNTFGISLNREGYATYRFEKGNWKSMPPKGIFRWHSFPRNMTVKLKHALKSPHIILSPSGDMTEFTADFGLEKKINRVSLLGQSDGKITIQRST